MKREIKSLLKYFQWLKRLKWKISHALFVVSIENLNILKYHTFFFKKTVLSIICSKCENGDEKKKKKN